MELADLIKNSNLSTPAFIVDADHLLRVLGTLRALSLQSGCKILYSIKSLPLSPVLAAASAQVDGFSVSSLFEARLAAEFVGGNGGIHLTTPGLRADELPELAGLCTHISFNSQGQYRRWAGLLPGGAGLRVNPRLSLVADGRHDPCRPHSKLGVAIDQLPQAPPLSPPLRGLHLHNNFDAAGHLPLRQTVAALKAHCPRLLPRLDWLNLGGGYRYHEFGADPAFVGLLAGLIADYGLDVYLEPGKAVVGDGGHLLATVVDLFDSDGKTIAILDTSVNHQPRVFEYQMRPDVHEHDPNGGHPAQLAGCTCLAGDLFGDYRFRRPLRLGDTVLFKGVGAYSLVKASRFNGYNLPTVYWHERGRISPVKRYSYQDFRQQWLADQPR